MIRENRILNLTKDDLSQKDLVGVVLPLAHRLVWSYSPFTLHAYTYTHPYAHVHTLLKHGSSNGGHSERTANVGWCRCDAENQYI